MGKISFHRHFNNLTAQNLHSYFIPRRYEKSGEPRRALKHFAEAFKLCDNDARLRAKIHNCYKLVKKSSSDAS